MTPQFVKVASSFGLVTVWMAPFVSVSAGSFPSRASLRKRLAHFAESGIPLVAQILGHDPEAMAATASRLADIGIEFVGLNFACPSGYVLSSGSGGALLRNPELIRRIVEAVSTALRGRAALIVKLRSGWDSPSESKILLPLIREAGSDACIYHYRTVAEKYDVVSGGTERIAKAVALAGSMPLVGNGDIRSPADAETMLAQSSCAAVAVARGFMADPFLVRRLLGSPAPSLEEGRVLFLKTLKDLGGKIVRGNVLELAKEMYGESSETFRSMI